MVLKTLSTYPPRLIFRIFKFLLQRPKKLKKSTKRAAKSDFFRRFNCCEPCPDNISDKTYDKWLFILYLIFFDFSRVLNDFFAWNIDRACFQKRMFSLVRSWIIRITCMIYLPTNWKNGSPLFVVYHLTYWKSTKIFLNKKECWSIQLTWQKRCLVV